MNQYITINNRKIGAKYSPYVIAEMSANHNGSIENALKIILQAKACGASAVKIQTYKPDTITLNCRDDDFYIKEGLWEGRTLYELYEWAHTPWEWHRELFSFSKENNITLFSSPFDETAVDLLEDLNAPAYKIASFEAIDINLIKYVASTKKPMIISTGMADAKEIEEAIDAAVTGGCNELVILHCVSGYPAPAADYNLKTILDMQRRFGVIVGLSDHTLDNTTAITSIALGVSVIEKHFTLDRSRGGPDDSFSLEKDELSALCKDVSTAWQSLGNINYKRKDSEKDNLKFRRSLYFVNDLGPGAAIKLGDIKSVRPGYGLPPKMLQELIGKKLKRAVKFGKKVELDDFYN